MIMIKFVFLLQNCWFDLLLIDKEFKKKPLLLTVSIISSDPRCKDDNARFITVL